MVQPRPLSLSLSPPLSQSLSTNRGIDDKNMFCICSNTSNKVKKKCTGCQFLLFIYFFLKRVEKKERKKSAALSANYPPSSILRVMETIGAFYIIMKLRKVSQFSFFLSILCNCQHEYLPISPGSVFSRSVGRSVRAGAFFFFFFFFFYFFF